MTVDLARKLQLLVQSRELAIEGMNKMFTEARGSVEIIIKSHITGYQRRLYCLLVPEIKDRVPNSVFPRERVEPPANISLADPQFHIPRRVDMLICAGATTALFSIRQVNLSRDECDLYVQITQFGWVVIGGLIDKAPESVSCELTDLNKQLTRFCEVEECIGEIARSQEDLQCEKHFATHTTRDSNGRYAV